MLDELWEATSIDDIEEWFREPWNDSRHAVVLALAARNLAGNCNDQQVVQIRGLNLVQGIARNFLNTVDYDRVEEIRYAASRSADRIDVFIEAAASILMNWIANSDGGGHVANVHLAGAFWPQLRDGTLSEDNARELVGNHRAADFGMNFHAPENQLFRWLWLNGRYRVAMMISRGSRLTSPAP
jgi:hypothetical protein